MIAQTMKARRQKPLFIIDIAVPRDVEATAGDLEQVFLSPALRAMVGGRNPAAAEA